jgi:uncharacterized membrane protein YdjX (TVP38/TMEM64 family)
MATYNNKSRRFRRAFRRLIALSFIVAASLAVLQYIPVGDLRDPVLLGFWAERLHANPWAGPLVVAAFVVGSLVMFPVSALIAAAGIVLGPIDGLLWAVVGSLLGASLTYWLARVLPEPVLDDWIGPWIRRLGMRFGRNSIVSVMVARNIPIAPFTLVNVMAGAANIRYRDYLIGTILGMGPMIAALTILGDRLRGALENPTLSNLLLLSLAFIVWFVIGLGLQILSNRLVSMRRG